MSCITVRSDGSELLIDVGSYWLGRFLCNSKGQSEQAVSDAAAVGLIRRRKTGSKNMVNRPKSTRSSRNVGERTHAHAQKQAALGHSVTPWPFNLQVVPRLLLLVGCCWLFKLLPHNPQKDVTWRPVQAWASLGSCACWVTLESSWGRGRYLLPKEG